jgi:hypothetical protein
MFRSTQHKVVVVPLLYMQSKGVYLQYKSVKPLGENLTKHYQKRRSKQLCEKSKFSKGKRPYHYLELQQIQNSTNGTYHLQD